MSAIDPIAMLRPRRKITGMSAILLPFTASGDIDWPGFDSLDTARLARRVLSRDEAPDCKLSSLARLFRAEVTPCHRALADAQATVDVLHGLMARLGNLGVHSLEELRTFSAMVTPQQRRLGPRLGPTPLASRTPSPTKCPTPCGKKRAMASVSSASSTEHRRIPISLRPLAIPRAAVR